MVFGYVARIVIYDAHVHKNIEQEGQIDQGEIQSILWLPNSIQDFSIDA